MSKYNVEQTIYHSIKLLEDIDQAVRLNDDAKLRKLCGEAGRSARELEKARGEMHSHWED